MRRTQKELAELERQSLAPYAQFIGDTRVRVAFTDKAFVSKKTYGHWTSRKKYAPGFSVFVIVAVLLTARLVWSDIQSVRLVENCGTFVLPTVSPATSNRNWLPDCLGPLRVIGSGLATVMVMALVAVAK